MGCITERVAYAKGLSYQRTTRHSSNRLSDCLQSA